MLTDAGLPRDGGIADLLTRSRQPGRRRFAAVVCEDIERSARDMLRRAAAGKGTAPRQGIPLFATDEPAESPA